MKPAYIPSLDGLRAFAALIVFFSHIFPFVPGMPGVTIFFFLSGYLITTLLRLEYQAIGGVNFAGFYLRRTVRILPPLYIVLFGAVLLQRLHLLSGTLDGAGFASELLFVTNYRMIWHPLSIGSGLEVLWTLAVEEHFYLLFPIAFLLLSRHARARRQALILGLAVLGFLAWRIVIHMGMHAGVSRTMYGSDTRMDTILFGCIMAIVRESGDERSLVINDQVKSGVVVTAFPALVFSRIVWRNENFRETLRYTLEGLALFSCFTYAISSSDSPVYRLLNWRPVRFMGLISYDFYLVHLVIISAVKNNLSDLPAVRITLSLILSITLGSALYFLVDRPLARWKRRFERPATPRFDPDRQPRVNTVISPSASGICQ